MDSVRNSSGRDSKARHDSLFKFHPNPGGLNSELSRHRKPDPRVEIAPYFLVMTGV